MNPIDPKIRKSKPLKQSDSPWASRKWASEYLCEDPDTTDKRLTDSTAPVKGKIRYRKIQDESKCPRVRVWKADVIKLLPPLDGFKL